MTRRRNTSKSRIRNLVATAATSVARLSTTAAGRGISSCQRAAAVLPGALMELVFPPACISCGVELEDGLPRLHGHAMCDECYDSLELLHGPVCQRCSGPLPLLMNISTGSTNDRNAKQNTGCYRCRGRKLWFDQTLAAGLYEGRLREVVLRMKSDHGDPLSLAMGQLLWELRRDELASCEIDVVSPIPLHWRRRLIHRTNSATLLAEVLANRLHRPLADGLLRRRRSTRPQSELTPPQRWENVRQAFTVNASHHLNKAHVLLVDDILTTGATCSEAARALRKAGAARITVAVIARGVGETR